MVACSGVISSTSTKRLSTCLYRYRDASGLVNGSRDEGACTMPARKAPWFCERPCTEVPKYTSAAACNPKALLPKNTVLRYRSRISSLDNCFSNITAPRICRSFKRLPEIFPPSSSFLMTCCVIVEAPCLPPPCELASSALPTARKFTPSCS